MLEIIIILITVTSIFYILLPLFLKGSVKIIEVFSDISELSEKKEILEKNLSDLSFDYQMGKLDDDDYNSMRSDYSNEINKIIHGIKNIKQTAHSGAKTKMSNKDVIKECPKCGWKNSAKNKYCANCGVKLE